MGIQINGNNDIVSALDGSWTAEGASINTTGILTATTFKGNVTGTACTFVDGNFTGNVTIGGTLTYEDVTNVDAVGLVTARTGVVSPYADIDDWIDVGNNIQLGNAGVITATTFKGGTFFGTGADINGGSGYTIEIHGEADGTGDTQAGYCIWVRGKFTNSVDIEILDG